MGGAVLPGEPVVLRLTWRNTSDKTVEFREEQFLGVTVRRAGDSGAPRPLWVLRRPTRAGPATLTLAPGKTWSRKVPMVLGRPENNDRSPAEFVFPAAGKYSFAVQGVADPASLSVTVQDPASAGDVAARALWTVDVARCLVSERRDPVSLAAIEKIYTDCPGSRYAPYALWAHGDELAQREDLRSAPRAAALTERLLDRYADFPLREETFKALVDLYADMGDKESARETAEDLAQAMPAGEAVAALKQLYGDTFDKLGPRRRAPPTGATVVRTSLSLSGAEAIPAPVRQVFEGYWKSVSGGDLQALAAMLTRDFMSDYGSRGAFVSALWQHRMNATAGAMQVTVKKAGMAASFDRPRSLPRGEARHWRGNLCVVEGSLNVKWTIPNVTRGDTLQAPWACWVFYGYPDGTWKLLSETAPSRNYLVGAMGQALTQRLTKTFATWSISDGRRQRSPYEEIKARLNLADKVVDSRTQWVSVQVRMTGAARDEVQVIGQVRMLTNPTAAEPGSDVWVEKMVAIFLVLGDGGDLVLRSWDFFDASGLPSGARPGP